MERDQGIMVPIFFLVFLGRVLEEFEFFFVFGETMRWKLCYLSNFGQKYLVSMKKLKSR